MLPPLRAWVCGTLLAAGVRSEPDREGVSVLKPSLILPLAVLVAFGTTLGCALVLPPLTSPAHGGSTWRALTSARFAMKTDLSRSDALEALGALERTYGLFEEVAFPGERARGGRINVVLFRRERDYRALGVKGSDAYFTPELANDPEPEPTAVMFGGLSDANRRVFQHELAHHFMRRALTHVPVWLNEGMAEYYSTLETRDGEVLLGKVPPGVVFTSASDWKYLPAGATHYAIPRSGVPSIYELLTATPEVFYAASSSKEAEPTLDEERRQRGFYAGSWALVHMLRNLDDRHRRPFGAYLDALAGGARARNAWEQSFASIAPDALQLDFDAYLRKGSLTVRARRFVPREPPPPEEERTLSDAEVHLLWARLDAWGGQGTARARRQLDEALQSAPSSVDVHFWRGLFFVHRGDDATAETELQIALDAKPREPRFLLTRLRLEMKRATQSRATFESLTTRLAEVATTATELDLVAQARAALGRPDDGLPFAERAIRAEPDCWRCLDTRAQLLSAMGRHDEAVTAEARALELLPEGYRDAPLLARYRKYQAAARAKATAPPPLAPAAP